MLEVARKEKEDATRRLAVLLAKKVRHAKRIERENAMRVAMLALSSPSRSVAQALLEGVDAVAFEAVFRERMGLPPDPQPKTPFLEIIKRKIAE